MRRAYWGLVVALAAGPAADLAAVKRATAQERPRDPAVAAAAALLSQQKQAEAAAALEKLLAANPEPAVKAEALLELGRARLALRNEKAALDALRQAFELTEYDERLGPEAGLLLGDTLYRREQYAEAAPAFRRATRWPAFREAARAYFMVGEAYRLAGNPAEAAVAYSAAVERYPTSPYAARAGLAAAEAYLQLNKPDPAELEYRQLLRLHAGTPEAAHAQIGLGRVALLRGDVPTARAALQGAVVLFPAVRRHAELRLAECSLAEGKLDDARSRYVALLTADDPLVNGAAQYGLASVFERQGRPDAAEEALRKLAADRKAGRWAGAARIRLARARLAKDPGAAVRELGGLLAERPEPELRSEAEGLLRDLAEKNPGTALARNAQAALQPGPGPAAARVEPPVPTPKPATEKPVAPPPPAVTPAVSTVERDLDGARKALEAGRYAEALPLFRKVLEGSPPTAARLAALAGAAEAAAGLNDAAQATAATRDLLGANPSAGLLAQTHFRMGQAHERGGRASAALSLYQTALKEQPAEPVRAELLWGAGRLLARERRGAEAEPLLRELVSRYPQAKKVPEALYALGWCHQEAGRPEQALAAFGRVAKEHPQHPLAADARFRLGEAAYAGGDYRAAAELYRAATAGPSEIADRAGYKLGWSLRQLGDHGGAAEAFAAVATRYPQSELAPESRLRAGEAYLHLERDAEALKLLESVREQGRLGAEARVGTALAYLMQGSFDRSFQLATEVAQPKNGWTGGRAQLVRAEAAFLKDGPEAALVEYLRAASLWGRYPELAAEARFRAGECYEKLGDRKAARAAWQEVADRFGETDWARRSRERLKAGEPDGAAPDRPAPSKPASSKKAPDKRAAGKGTG